LTFPTPDFDERTFDIDQRSRVLATVSYLLSCLFGLVWFGFDLIFDGARPLGFGYASLRGRALSLRGHGMIVWF
jgi:hypothetical protein